MDTQTLRSSYIDYFDKQADNEGLLYVASRAATFLASTSCCRPPFHSIVAADAMQKQYCLYLVLDRVCLILCKNSAL